MAQAATASTAPEVSVASTSTLRALLGLTKPRIIELLLVTTVPTMVLAARGLPPIGLVAATLVGGSLSAAGANALNMVYERDIDSKMSRTRHRPLVTGALPIATALAFALALEVAAFGVLWGFVNLLAACLTLAAAFFYVVVYTIWLKRQTSQNIVIGGAAGAAPVLVAWAAVTGGLSPAAWGLFAVVVLWTPPHFWALALRFKDDYATAGVPMLPVVASPREVVNRVFGYAVTLVAVSLAIVLSGKLGPIYLVGAAASGGVFIYKAWVLRKHPESAYAMKLFHYSITYLTVLFACVGISVVLPW